MKVLLTLFFVNQVAVDGTQINECVYNAGKYQFSHFIPLSEHCPKEIYL